jgi:hypothetical protein
VLEDDAGFSGDIAQFISAYQTLGALRKNWSNATPLENHRTFPPKTNASWSHDTPKIQGLYHLVGGLEHEFYDFPYIGNFIIPTDFHIFSEGLKPPSNSHTVMHMEMHIFYSASFRPILREKNTWHIWNKKTYCMG